VICLGRKRQSHLCMEYVTYHNAVRVLNMAFGTYPMYLMDHPLASTPKLLLVLRCEWRLWV
jgi:hypothetical protein